MSDRIFTATRKGPGDWPVARRSFLGDNVSMVLPDWRDGAVYAALDHGHFGVKMRRSRDGGESFEALRERLPQQDAYDLTFRHGLDVDPTGHWLAFGSTTGSLWVSEDQGERWHAVSEHLPPVDCVRFA